MERSAAIVERAADTFRRFAAANANTYPAVAEELARKAAWAAKQAARLRAREVPRPAPALPERRREGAVAGTPRRARVLVADDHELAREALVSILAREPDLEVVGEARDGYEAIRETGRLRPDLVLMDVRMPRLDGLQAARLDRQAAPETRVVVLSSHEGRDFVLEALRAGASGYLPKGASRREVLATLRDVLAGAIRVHQDVAAQLLAEDAASEEPVRRHVRVHDAAPAKTAARSTAPAGRQTRGARAPMVAGTSSRSNGRRAPLLPEAERLSARERDVLRLVARGLTNDAVGRELHVTLNTVKTHVAHALRKLGAADRAEAAARAAALGLLEEDG